MAWGAVCALEMDCLGSPSITSRFCPAQRVAHIRKPRLSPQPGTTGAQCVAKITRSPCGIAAKCDAAMRFPDTCTRRCRAYVSGIGKRACRVVRPEQASRYATEVRSGAVRRSGGLRRLDRQWQAAPRGVAAPQCGTTVSNAIAWNFGGTANRHAATSCNTGVAALPAIRTG